MLNIFLRSRMQRSDRDRQVNESPAGFTLPLIHRRMHKPTGIVQRMTAERWKPDRMRFAHPEKLGLRVVQRVRSFHPISQMPAAPADWQQVDMTLPNGRSGVEPTLNRKEALPEPGRDRPAPLPSLPAPRFPAGSIFDLPITETPESNKPKWQGPEPGSRLYRRIEEVRSETAQPPAAPAVEPVKPVEVQPKAQKPAVEPVQRSPEPVFPRRRAWKEEIPSTKPSENAAPLDFMDAPAFEAELEEPAQAEAVQPDPSGFEFIHATELQARDALEPPADSGSVQTETAAAPPVQRRVEPAPGPVQAGTRAPALPLRRQADSQAPPAAQPVQTAPDRIIPPHSGPSSQQPAPEANPAPQPGQTWQASVPQAEFPEAAAETGPELPHSIETRQPADQVPSPGEIFRKVEPGPSPAQEAALPRAAEAHPLPLQIRTAAPAAEAPQSPAHEKAPEVSTWVPAGEAEKSALPAPPEMPLHLPAAPVRVARKPEPSQSGIRPTDPSSPVEAGPRIQGKAQPEVSQPPSPAPSQGHNASAFPSQPWALAETPPPMPLEQILTSPQNQAPVEPDTQAGQEPVPTHPALPESSPGGEQQAEAARPAAGGQLPLQRESESRSEPGALQDPSTEALPLDLVKPRPSAAPQSPARSELPSQPARIPAGTNPAVQRSLQTSPAAKPDVNRQPVDDKFADGKHNEVQPAPALLAGVEKAGKSPTPVQGTAESEAALPPPVVIQPALRTAGNAPIDLERDEPAQPDDRDPAGGPGTAVPPPTQWGAQLPGEVQWKAEITTSPENVRLPTSPQPQPGIPPSRETPAAHLQVSRTASSEPVSAGPAPQVEAEAQPGIQRAGMGAAPPQWQAERQPASGGAGEMPLVARTAHEIQREALPAPKASPTPLPGAGLPGSGPVSSSPLGQTGESFQQAPPVLPAVEPDPAQEAGKIEPVYRRGGPTPPPAAPVSPPESIQRKTAAFDTAAPYSAALPRVLPTQATQVQAGDEQHSQPDLPALESADQAPLPPEMVLPGSPIRPAYLPPQAGEPGGTQPSPAANDRPVLRKPEGHISRREVEPSLNQSRGFSPGPAPGQPAAPPSGPPASTREGTIPPGLEAPCERGSSEMEAAQPFSPVERIGSGQSSRQSLPGTSPSPQGGTPIQRLSPPEVQPSLDPPVQTEPAPAPAVLTPVYRKSPYRVTRKAEPEEAAAGPGVDLPPAGSREAAGQPLVQETRTAHPQETTGETGQAAQVTLGIHAGAEQAVQRAVSSEVVFPSVIESISSELETDAAVPLDPKELARQVYPLVRRMLLLEKERLFGRR